MPAPQPLSIPKPKHNDREELGTKSGSGHKHIAEGGPLSDGLPRTNARAIGQGSYLQAVWNRGARPCVTNPRPINSCDNAWAVCREHTSNSWRSRLALDAAQSLSLFDELR